MVDVKDISYNTFVSYRNIIYNYFLKVIGKKYLQDLKSEDFVKALDTTKRRGSRKDYAKEQKKAFRKKVNELTNVYSVEQISTLLYICKNEEPTIFMAILITVTTGLRISETIAIKYQNIDFLNNKIYIESQLGRTITNDGVPGQSLLTQEKRTKTHNSVREVKCGFKFVQWRKLRTTYATVLAQYNVSMKAISSSLGHYSTDFTKEVYVKSKRKVIDLTSMIKPFADEILYASEDSKSMEMPDVTNYYRI